MNVIFFIIIILNVLTVRERVRDQIHRPFCVVIPTQTAQIELVDMSCSISVMFI